MYVGTSVILKFSMIWAWLLSSKTCNTTAYNDILDNSMRLMLGSRLGKALSCFNMTMPLYAESQVHKEMVFQFGVEVTAQLVQAKILKGL